MTVMDVGKGNQMSLSSSISHHQFRQLEKDNFDAERSDFITPIQFNNCGSCERALEEQFPSTTVVYICDFHRIQAMQRWEKAGKKTNYGKTRNVLELNAKNIICN
ncbi:Hypothetical predicted protein [Paramuricea clavata]|uniref:Uncharacterized protein n=1 Tax=Paramuricea clavata TaxID=317549 RepID=A0A6S7IIF0_PARCT|nr:Hypothetical predicted protein [Paramuricea clavata]